MGGTLPSAAPPRSRACRGWSLALKSLAGGSRGEEEGRRSFEEEAKNRAGQPHTGPGELKASVKGGPASLQDKGCHGRPDRHPPDLMAAYSGRRTMTGNSFFLTAWLSGSAPWRRTRSFTTARCPCWQAKASIQFKSRWGLPGPARMRGQREGG